jgi:hypothetical protein
VSVAPFTVDDSPEQVRLKWAASYRRPAISLKMVDLFALGEVRVLRPGEPARKSPPPIVVALKSEDGRPHVIDGHHRVLRFRKEGYTHAYAWVLDYRGDTRYTRRSHERPRGR